MRRKRLAAPSVGYVALSIMPLYHSDLSGLVGSAVYPTNA